MIGWHIMDGADGQLARLTHSQSHFGKVLDGISDTATFLAVYAALALALGRKYGDRAYALVLVAGMFHAVQSATYEARRQEYERWGWGRKSAEPPQLPAPAHGGSRAAASARASLVEHLFGFLHRLFYNRLSFPAADITGKIGASMAAALDRQPESAALVREQYRRIFAPLVRRWSLLSANYRTLGIFVCVLAAVPEYYFVFEIVGASAVLALLIASEYACYRRLVIELDAAKVALP
jgi:pimeloyl-ACP methyl ester carboxylesterase